MSESFFSLKDRVVLITGASRGIGAAVARRFGKAGARVFINYNSNKEAAEKVLAEVRQFSPESELLGFNTAEAAEVDQGVKEVLKKAEKIDVLVANAGISREALLPRASPEHFEEVIRTNLLGSINVARACSRGMMKQRYGRMIFLSSVVGEAGNKGQSAYAASKSGIFGFAKSAALELASRNVTCNVVAPGFIETEMTQELAKEVKDAYLGQIPMGRMGSTEDVASCIHFLASEESGYLSGVTLDVNGGMLMR